MHARYYSANMGRFLSVDPQNRYEPLRASQPWNRYGYTLGNPLKYLDPNGEAAKIFFDNQTSGNVRGSFRVDQTAARVDTDFRRAGADAQVILRAPNLLDRAIALLKGDTVPHVQLVNSGDSTEIRIGVAGKTGGPEGLQVFVAMTSLDNPSTSTHEREQEGANVVSHEVGHELGLGHNQNDPPDLMTAENFQPVPDLDFNEDDAAILREVTNREKE